MYYLMMEPMIKSLRGVLPLTGRILDLKSENLNRQMEKNIRNDN